MIPEPSTGGRGVVLTFSFRSCFRAASITVKDELVYDHLRPWLGEWLTTLLPGRRHPQTSEDYFKNCIYRTQPVAKQRGGVVSQEAAADSGVSLRYSEELRDEIQRLHQHLAREKQSNKRAFSPPGGRSQPFSASQDKWRRLAAEGGAHVEAFEHVTLMTLDSLLKCAFSHDSDCQR